ncbi:DUF3159 domain-containing protein [Lysinibacter sp. HNR]|uniref:DUF3159 domain-containing protein n=1 Tax=Lysinibacter sp. HNR TaxID=3031408 RepID=UPI002434C822|nr:DUF3159 domain-containing protein [Lysinibacter sp. HNR]WGD36333.1 DUF3159 domain-containing protein [Lysinibacter sp. HNR]
MAAQSGDKIPESPEGKLPGDESSLPVSDREGDEPLPPGISEPGATSRSVRSGLVDSVARAATGEKLTKDAVLESLGGYWGMLESVLPGLVFLGVYILTHELELSVIAPVIIGVGFLVARIVRRKPISPALSGLLGIVFCVVIALLTGRAVDYFLTGFFTNAAWGLGLLVSVVVRWPLIGVGIGFFTGIGTSWRSDKKTFRIMTLVTLMWVGLFALRLVVQLPLFYAEQIEALGIARFVMGVPLFALLVVLSWLVVRSSIGRHSSAAGQSNENDVVAGEAAPSGESDK